MEILNARELAAFMWTLVLAGLLLTVRGVRERTWNIVKQALFSKLYIVWLSLAVYSVLLVIGLRSLGLWGDELLKDTVVWFVFCALAYPFQFHDPGKEPRVLRTLVRDSISVLIVLEVLIGTYVFSLWVELVFVPVVTSIVVMGAVAEVRKEYQPLADFFGKVQALIGVVLIASVIWRAAGDSTYEFIDTLLSSLMVVVLSVSCWPYIYMLRLSFAHEGMLWRIGWKKDVSNTLRHYAALRILRYLKFRPTEVPAFIRRNALGMSDIVDRGSLEELLKQDQARIRNGDHQA